MAAQRAAARPAAVPSGYDGYLYRNNLGAQGGLPAAAPYSLCPDIIRSSSAIPNAQSALTTQQSLQTLYDCDPDIGEANFYYLRTLNGGASGGTELSLYYAPAELILLPDLWQGPLESDGGRPSVNASADSGHFAVGDDPLLWKAPALTASNSFYAFVAQAGSEAVTVNDWLDLGTLMTQRLDLGFHNVGYVSPTQSWESALGLTIPASFADSAMLTLTLAASGFDGCKLGIIASRFTNAGKPVMLNPVQLTDGFTTGFQFSGDPGYEATLYVQCWNNGTIVAAGSTINLSISCVLPDNQLEEALSRNLLDSAYINHVARQLPEVGPQAVVPLGSVTFVAGDTS